MNNGYIELKAELTRKDGKTECEVSCMCKNVKTSEVAKTIASFINKLEEAGLKVTLPLLLELMPK